VGGAGAGKRIDTAAVALWNDMTAQDLADVDLAYAPPFSPVWDPIAIAARKVAEAARTSAATSDRMIADAAPADLEEPRDAHRHP
jgi:hypothetical protein